MLRGLLSSLMGQRRERKPTDYLPLQPQSISNQEPHGQSESDKWRAAILPMLLPVFFVSWMLLIGAGIVEALKHPSIKSLCVYIGLPLLLWYTAARLSRPFVRHPLLIPGFITAISGLACATFLLHLRKHVSHQLDALFNMQGVLLWPLFYMAANSDPGFIPKGPPPPPNYYHQQQQQQQQQQQPQLDGQEHQQGSVHGAQCCSSSDLAVPAGIPLPPSEEAMKAQAAASERDSVGCVPIPLSELASAPEAGEPGPRHAVRGSVAEAAGSGSSQEEEGVASSSDDSGASVVVVLKEQEVEKQQLLRRQRQQQQREEEDETGIRGDGDAKEGGEGQAQQWGWQWDASLYCYECNLWRWPRVRHCYKCGRCIDRYDHHCPAIRICVGRKNHHLFMITLAVFIVTEATFIVICRAYFHTKHLLSLPPDTPFFAPPTLPAMHWLEDCVRAFLQIYTAEPWVTGLACLAVIMESWQVPLLLFHLYCISKNITTYELMRWKRLPYLHHLDHNGRLAFYNPYHYGILTNWRLFIAQRDFFDGRPIAPQ